MGFEVAPIVSRLNLSSSTALPPVLFRFCIFVCFYNKKTPNAYYHTLPPGGGGSSFPPPTLALKAPISSYVIRPVGNCLFLRKNPTMKAAYNCTLPDSFDTTFLTVFLGSSVSHPKDATVESVMKNSNPREDLMALITPMIV